MSKLAALAAKRRQKENKKITTDGNAKLEPQEKQASTFSARRTPRPSAPELVEKTFGKRDSETHDLNRAEDIPVTSSISSTACSENRPRSVNTSAEPSKASTRPEPAAAIRASPSPFAATITARESAAADIHSSLASDFASVMSFIDSRAKPFDFIDPSPDDMVTKAQSTKGSS